MTEGVCRKMHNTAVLPLVCNSSLRLYVGRWQNRSIWFSAPYYETIYFSWKREDMFSLHVGAHGEVRPSEGWLSTSMPELIQKAAPLKTTIPFSILYELLFSANSKQNVAPMYLFLFYRYLMFLWYWLPLSVFSLENKKSLLCRSMVCPS